MGITYNGNAITCEGVINENEAAELRDHLKTTAPLKIDVDIHTCKDMHTSIIQLLAAYRINYECEFHHDAELNATFKKALDGSGVLE